MPPTNGTDALRGKSVQTIRGALGRFWQSPTRIGLHIDRERLSAVAMTVRSPAAVSLPGAQFSTPWFVGAPSSRAIAEVSAACAQIVSLYPGAAVQVSLPEPSATYAVFDFDAIPPSNAALEDLVRWRFGKDLHLNEAAIVCRCQRLGRTREHESVLAVALDSAWLAAVQQALDDAEMVATIIDTGVRYRFNRFYAQLVPTAGEGGLLAIETDYWTIVIWDECGAVRYVRSRWRNGLAPSDIVHEFARALQAYRGVAHDRSLRLYFTGETGASDELISLIAVETGEQCEFLAALASDSSDQATTPSFNAAYPA